MTMEDLHGKRITEGAKARLSGGYADSAVPTYLVHEAVTVVGFGRSRVIVKIDSPDYASRPMLRVLPRTLVLDEPKVAQKPLRNDEPLKGRQR